MDTDDESLNITTDATSATSKNTGDYDVGYGRPPRHHQFKSGQSGNPRGRPRKKPIKPLSHPNEPFKDALLKAAYRRVKTENGPTVTMAEAVAHSIATRAAQGHFQSQKLFIHHMTNIEKQDRKETEDFFKEAYEYKAKWTQELKIIREAGLEEPELVPHPDHIDFDPLTLSVIINGPVTEEQKKRWDILVARRDEAVKTIKEEKQALKKAKSPEDRKWHEDNIAFEEQILKSVLKGLQQNKR